MMKLEFERFEKMFKGAMESALRCVCEKEHLDKDKLGSLSGGMTSTPALGILISVAGSDSVAAAYAATYPIALVMVVLSNQLVAVFC